MSIPRKDSVAVYNVVAAKFIGLKSIIGGERKKSINIPEMKLIIQRSSYARRD
jgi:hypothetical protein